MHQGKGRNGGWGRGAQHRSAAPGHHRALYSNPTTNTQLQLLKRNTFNRNNKYLQRTIIQKNNDNKNKIINPKVEAPPHTAKGENKIKRKPFLTTILVLRLARSWSLWKWNRGAPIRSCRRAQNGASLVAGQTHARQSASVTPHQGSESQCNGFVR